MAFIAAPLPRTNFCDSRASDVDAGDDVRRQSQGVLPEIESLLPQPRLRDGCRLGWAGEGNTSAVRKASVSSKSASPRR